MNHIERIRSAGKGRERVLKNIRLFKLKLVELYGPAIRLFLSFSLSPTLRESLALCFFLHSTIIYRPNRHRNRERSIQTHPGRSGSRLAFVCLAHTHRDLVVCNQRTSAPHSLHHSTTKLVTYAKQFSNACERR